MPTTKKVSAVFLGLSALALLAGSAYAQNTSAIRQNTGLVASPSGSIRTQIQQRVETRQENVSNLTTAIKEANTIRVAALKTKLQKFKNQTKAAVAERVNTNLGQINQNQTAQMQKYLTTMTAILEKLEARVNRNSPDIKDPAAVKVEIAATKQAITTASAAVAEQAKKDYTIEITSESKVRTDVKKQRNALHKDLLTMRILVKDAKQAVANAIRTAKSGAVPTAKPEGGVTNGQ